MTEIKSVSCILFSEEDVNRTVFEVLCCHSSSNYYYVYQSNEEDNIVYKQHQRCGRMFWTHPYIELNIEYMILIAAMKAESIRF